MEQIYEIGTGREKMKARVMGYARKLGWRFAAVAYHRDNVARVARCQAPDWTIYDRDFAARRAAR